jgi:uncharacterized protein (DUF58 family)
MAQELLDPVALARLGTLPLRAKVIVEGALTGLHRAAMRGSSVEFAEHKEYAPGDDIRRIDWKAVGRQDRYYIKQFEDETEMRTFLVLDASASMAYGRTGVNKFTYATYLAGALAYLLAKQGDPAGLVVHDSALRNYLPPSAGGGHLGELLRLLDSLAPGGATDLARALGRIGDLAQRRSLVVLFSDLLDAEPDATGVDEPPARAPDGDLARGPLAESLAQLRLRGHDVVVFHLLDRDEVDLPFQELTQFAGIEPADVRTLLAEPEDLKESFREESHAFRERWRRTCLQSRVEYRFATTDRAPGQILRAFIGERRRQRA